MHCWCTMNRSDTRHNAGLMQGPDFPVALGMLYRNPVAPYAPARANSKLSANAGERMEAVQKLILRGKTWRVT